MRCWPVTRNMSIITIQIEAGLTAGYKGRSKAVNVLKLGFDRELRTVPVCISRRQKKYKRKKQVLCSLHKYLLIFPWSCYTWSLSRLLWTNRDITYFNVYHIQQTKETKRLKQQQCLQYQTHLRKASKAQHQTLGYNTSQKFFLHTLLVLLEIYATLYPQLNLRRWLFARL